MSHLCYSSTLSCINEWCRIKLFVWHWAESVSKLQCLFTPIYKCQNSNYRITKRFLWEKLWNDVGLRFSLFASDSVSPYARFEFTTYLELETTKKSTRSPLVVQKGSCHLQSGTRRVRARISNIQLQHVTMLYKVLI